MKQAEIKENVKKKYSSIALQVQPSSCCGSTGCCGSGDYTIMSEDYSQLHGYNVDADFGLGCGLPTRYAGIKQGDTVVDLGSGAGNDCFIARAETGESGRVIGVDFSPEMVAKAKENVTGRGYTNIDIRHGDIENMPVEDNSADVVISNCVLNLLPSKRTIFREIFRVLKPGGHFCISDIVLTGELPPAITDAVEMYVGCIAGAIQKNEYLDYINNEGFNEVKIQKEKMIIIPDDILINYLDKEAMELFKKSTSPVVSMTITAQKPAVL